jgi:hypothetical protein
VTRQRRFIENDPDLMKIRTRWQQALRQAVARLPNIKLKAKDCGSKDESIQLEEGSEGSAGSADASAPQMVQTPASRESRKR